MIIEEWMIKSVSEVNSYVKRMISQDENLKYLLIKGEISNFKQGAGGHLYFSLKDERSLISVVMFKEYAKTLTFTPKDGDEVVMLATLDVYEARGTYQLYAKSMDLKGIGAKMVELEELKKKLAAEGLFSKPKRSITRYPKAIGIITALNSAAIKDLLINIKRRFPVVDTYIFPSSVQGENAPKELVKAFMKSQEYDLDTLIIGRGGGASEDLSAFNDEALVRAVYTSKMPVIAAVGHEIDYTLLDYVADVRVSTPTAAAEKATPDRKEIEQDLDEYLQEMKEGIKDQLGTMKEDLKDLEEELNDALANKINQLKLIIKGKKEQLLALNPKGILSRGYSITLNKDGKPISSKDDVNSGDIIKTIVSDGEIKSRVEDE
ncbi:MAG: exodeoxyribonuclease VII large subunit [Bacilli bacterium]|nr:exodeoxyribonuclease VII large subunit [Bacilli bacterium]